MKGFFLFLAMILLGDFFAQGNLQFSQAKLVSAQETVPVGKIWKLENYLPNVSLAIELNRLPNQATAGGTRNFVILVNSVPIYLQTNISREVGRDDAYWNQQGYAAVSDFKIFDAPIWFPAGTTLAASTNVGFISVMEFNVVP
ncbi:MAG: hypothetical protein EBU82_10360 [Flavobacteriia bacterium]|jgi:hypothetical protein|nr:hypothetical protein [Flavobacteriia bacterium]NBP29758.1 hypothetical protein [Flavobacteriia bacterium]